MWLPRRLLAGAALAGLFALMAHSEYVVVQLAHVLLLMPLLAALPVVAAWIWPVLLRPPGRASYPSDPAAQQFSERLINLCLCGNGCTVAADSLSIVTVLPASHSGP